MITNKMSESEIKLRKTILPMIKGSLYKIANELASNGALTFSDDKPTKINTSDNNENEREKKNVFINDFSFFRTLVSQIFNTSGLNYSPTTLRKTSEILKYLQEVRIYFPSWLNNSDVVNVIDVEDRVIQDDENVSTIKSILEKNRVDVVSEMNALIQGFTRYVTSKLFDMNSSWPSMYAVDGSFKLPMIANADLLVLTNSKRGVAYSPNREDVYQLLEKLKLVDVNRKNEYSHILLFAYSNLTRADFESVKFKFSQLVRQLSIGSNYENRIHLVPCSIHEPGSAETELRNIFDSLSKLDFSHEFKGVETRKNNETILPQAFRTKNTGFDILIDPNNTDYWRFGFFLSNSETLVLDGGNRHSAGETIDIHICVGDKPQGEWQNKNHLGITSYKAHEISDGWTPFQNYSGEAVTMQIRFYEKQVKVTVKIREKLIGSKIFESNKEFVHFGAWCDYKVYNLKVQFEVKNKKNW